MEEGVYVTAFSFPVVPRGKARIRTQMSSALSEAEIQQVAAELNVRPEDVIEMETRMAGGDVALTIDELFGQRSFLEEDEVSAERIAEGRYGHFVDRTYRLDHHAWGVFSLDRLARTLIVRSATLGKDLVPVVQAVSVPDGSLVPLPMQRIGGPEEVVAATAFLASDESSYCHGTEIVVDGGMTVAAASRAMTASGAEMMAVTTASATTAPPVS